MSNISANIVVQPFDINISMEDPSLTITPEIINLTVVAAGGTTGTAGGGVYQLQYNNGSGFGGIPTATYSNGNVVFSNIANLKINGGTNGYFLQTDGTGNLDWAAGGGGNGAPGGSNTQIQYNDNGLFGGNTGFTFNEITGNVDIPGNLTVVGNINATIANANYANFAGEVVDASQPNITSLGTLTGLSVTGTTSVQQAIEKVTTNGTGSTGTVDFDLLTQAILYKTANASSNFTINIRGNSTISLNTMLSSNQSITCTYLNTNGATGYYANVIKIDGTTITPKWILNGTPTSGTTNGIDSYTFNIVKTASGTYTVLGSKVGFS